MDFWKILEQLFLSATSAIVVATSAILPTSNDLAQKTASAASSTINEIKSGDNFKLLGNYQYLGQQLQYWVAIPKKGGVVEGEVSGVCHGVVLGVYQPGNVPELQGKINTKCQITIFSQDASASFSGRVNQGEKKIYLDWIGDGFIGGKRGSISLNLSD